MEYIGKEDSNIRIGAILGLGIAYAGSQKEEVEICADIVLLARRLMPLINIVS